MKASRQHSGVIVLYALMATGVLLLFLGGLFTYLNVQTRLLRWEQRREAALTIAEAGIDRFQWQLAHDPDEYVQGTDETAYYDPSGDQIGVYDVDVTPPQNGSSILTIRSTAWTLDDPGNKRILEIEYGKPSLAKYSFLTNSDAWFGDSENIIGLMHANGGIRMDGTCNSIMSSAKETYNCQEYHGCGAGQEKPGIWGDAPESCSSMWEFPTLAVDFEAFNISMTELSEEAGQLFEDSGEFGYHFIFKSDGTIDVYVVTALQPPVQSFDTYGERRPNSYDIRREEFQQNIAIPANGLIFVQDSFWVEGTVHGRVTIAAGLEEYNPETAPMVMIPNNLVYSTKDGSDVLGLIGQRDVIIPRYVPDTIEVNGALLAINGATQRFFYPGDHKDEITTYGSIITNGVWTWSWVSGGGAVVSGYEVVNSIYDPNLLYSPPPYFPTEEEFERIRWEDVSGE